MSLRIGLIGAGYWGARLLRVSARSTASRWRWPSTPTRRSAPRWAATCASPPTCRAVGGSLDRRRARRHAAVVALCAGPAALSAGKHCWVEKPLALRADDARELVALAAERARTLFVDETFLYDPLVQRAAWIRSGRSGPALHLSFERLGMGRIRRDSDVWWNSAPHDLSILRYFVADEVESVRVEPFAVSATRHRRHVRRHGALPPAASRRTSI